MESKFGEGFHLIDTRFDGIATRFDGIDTRFNGIDSSIDTRFNAIDAYLKQLLAGSSINCIRIRLYHVEKQITKLCEIQKPSTFQKLLEQIQLTFEEDHEVVALTLDNISISNDRDVNLLRNDDMLNVTFQKFQFLAILK